MKSRRCGAKPCVLLRAPELVLHPRYPKPVISEPSRPDRNPVWLPLILLVVSALAFWVLPLAWKNKPVQVEFVEAKK